jgi:hypothetical protein
LSSFPQDVLADLCHEVLDFLMYRVGSVDTDILQEKLAPAGVIVPTERAQGAVNALTFTFRASIHAEVAAEDLTTELKSFGTGARSFCPRPPYHLDCVCTLRTLSHRMLLLAPGLMDLATLVCDPTAYHPFGRLSTLSLFRCHRLRQHTVLQRPARPHSLTGDAPTFCCTGASVWTAKAVKVLTYVWSQRGAEACAEVKQLANDVMNIGRLVSFNWKLGLSTESSLVKGLGRAFVAVEIKVVDSGANIVVHSFEMSLPQFQKFSKQMKEMQAVVKEIE